MGLFNRPCSHCGSSNHTRHLRKRCEEEAKNRATYTCADGNLYPCSLARDCLHLCKPYIDARLLRAQLIALAGPPLLPGTPQTPTKPPRARHVYALRGWRAVSLDGTTLKGATGATMSGRLSDVAVCKTRLEMPSPDECPHTPPVWDCTCGHYAVFNRAMLEPRSVVAEVTAIGPGIICGEGGKELGMRMRQYRLETLYVPEQCEKFAPMLQKLYEVPVLLMPGNPQSESAYAAALQRAVTASSPTWALQVMGRRPVSPGTTSVPDCNCNACVNGWPQYHTPAFQQG